MLCAYRYQMDKFIYKSERNLNWTDHWNELMMEVYCLVRTVNFTKGNKEKRMNKHRGVHRQDRWFQIRSSRPNLTSEIRRGDHPSSFSSQSHYCNGDTWASPPAGWRGRLPLDRGASGTWRTGTAFIFRHLDYQRNVWRNGSLPVMFSSNFKENCHILSHENRKLDERLLCFYFLFFIFFFPFSLFETNSFA